MNSACLPFRGFWWKDIFTTICQLEPLHSQNRVYQGWIKASSSKASRGTSGVRQPLTNSRICEALDSPGRSKHSRSSDTARLTQPPGELLTSTASTSTLPQRCRHWQAGHRTIQCSHQGESGSTRALSRIHSWPTTSIRILLGRGCVSSFGKER